MHKAVPALLAALILAPSLAAAQSNCDRTPSCAEGSQWNAESKSCEQIVSS